MEMTLKTVLAATPETIYNTWLSSEGHSAMTGSDAEISIEVDTPFTTWDRYISGTNILLEPYWHMLQSWRTTDFSDEEPDSRLEILLQETEGGTELTLIHTLLPENGEQYRQGWIDYYFEPLELYFSSL